MLAGISQDTKGLLSYVLLQMIIELKYFLCSILDIGWIKNVLLIIEKMPFSPWLPAEMLLDLIFRSVGNFSSITLQIKEQEL